MTDPTLPPLITLPRRCLAVVDMEMKEIKYYDSMGGNNSRSLRLVALVFNFDNEHFNDHLYAGVSAHLRSISMRSTK